MRACVFAGPSLGRLRPDLPEGVVLLPPAARGDLYRAALQGPRAIGLIDGYFDGVPAVAHKEILWALHHGIHVFGASSMGALRAAELAPYGMRGIGEVFRAYAAGEIESDEEVAVLHGPAEAGWISLSEAMVNVRATLRVAQDQVVLDETAAASVALAAKGLFYKERTWPAVVHSTPGVARDDLARLEAWLRQGRVDQKRADALLLIDEFSSLLAADPPPFTPGFAFEHSQIWDELAAEAAGPGSDDGTNPEIAALLIGELRLGPEEASRALVERALARVLALREAERAGVAADKDATRRRLERLRIEHGLFRAADREAWLAAREVGPDWLDRRAGGDALAAAVARDLAPVLDATLLDELRLVPDFPERLARARRKRELLDSAAPAGVPRSTSLPLWLGRRLGRDEPPTAAEFGFAGAEQFHRALLAEYLYSRLLNARGAASTDN